MTETQPGPSSDATESSLERTVGRVLGPLLCAATLVGLAVWSWGKWPDVQVDFGRELYVPWRLVEGEVLYRDIAWFNGPLSPYLCALWFALFGTSFWVLSWANLIILGLCGVTLYRVLRACTSRAGAHAGVLVLFGIFAFNHLVVIANYNWISPYSHEMTHGVTLALVSLWCAGRYRRRGQLGWVVGSGLALGLVFLTKAEVFIAALGGVGVTLGGLWWRGGIPGGVGRGIGAWIGAALVPPILAWLLLMTAMPVGEALVGVLGSWPGVVAGDTAELEYYRRGMGLDDPAMRLGALFEWAFWIALPLVACVAVEFAVRGIRSVWAVWALAFAAAGTCFGLTRGDLDWLSLPAPLPLFALLGGVAAAIRLLRGSDPQVRQRSALRLGLAVFAVVLLFKILLTARVQHYGFALAMPAGALFAAMVIGWIPEWLRTRGGSGRVVAGGGAGLLAGAAVSLLAISSPFYEHKGQPMGGEADRFQADARGQIVRAVLQYTRQLVPPDATVLVLPEGIMLNYLLKRRTPTRFVNFMPPEVVLFGEDNMLAALEASPPEVVILVHKPTTEYGYDYFGTDYGQEIMAWVRQNYIGKVQPVSLDNPPRPPLRDGTTFSIQIMERR